MGRYTVRRLIQAAQQMGAGELSAEQIHELEATAGWDEITHLSQAFAQDVLLFLLARLEPQGLPTRSLHE